MSTKISDERIILRKGATNHVTSGAETFIAIRYVMGSDCQKEKLC
jgi:hypothetical protein